MLKGLLGFFAFIFFLIVLILLLVGSYLYRTYRKKLVIRKTPVLMSSPAQRRQPLVRPS